MERRGKTHTLPIFDICVWAVALNAAWEFLQCTVLYDMWRWGVVRGSLYMWGAIVGDVGIVLGVYYVASKLAGASHLLPLDSRGWGTMLAIGLAAAIFLEWLARAIGLWGYTDLMPTIAIGDNAVGVSPVLQITLLPALALFLAGRRPFVRGGRAT